MFAISYNYCVLKSIDVRQTSSRAKVHIYVQLDEKLSHGTSQKQEALEFNIVNIGHNTVAIFVLVEYIFYNCFTA